MRHVFYSAVNVLQCKYSQSNLNNMFMSRIRSNYNVQNYFQNTYTSSSMLVREQRQHPVVLFQLALKTNLTRQQYLGTSTQTLIKALYLVVRSALQYSPTKMAKGFTKLASTAALQILWIGAAQAYMMEFQQSNEIVYKELDDFLSQTGISIVFFYINNRSFLYKQRLYSLNSPQTESLYFFI